jgi:hypothetical protein
MATIKTERGKNLQKAIDILAYFDDKDLLEFVKQIETKLQVSYGTTHKELLEEKSN